MLSRVAQATQTIRPSILYRTVTTSGKTSQAAAATATPADNVRRYPHDAPERDMVNFPPMKQPVQAGVAQGLTTLIDYGIKNLQQVH